MEAGCPVGKDDPDHARRFESWKEIAAYFRRDVRTVRRWERNEALPVHRHHHRSRGSVYAFQDELDGWLAHRTAPVPRRDEVLRYSHERTLLIVGVTLGMGLAAWLLVVNVPIASPAGSATAGQGATAQVTGNGPTQRVTDVDLRETVLLARHHLSRRAGYRQQAQSYLEAAVKRAPDLAEAHALLGEAYLRQAVFEPSRRAEAWPKAEAAVRRALALDGDLSTAHTVLSRVLLIRDWNFEAAAAESLRAIELDPDAPDARSAYALCLRAAGRLAEAIGERERAQRADPLNPQWLIFLGDEYSFARRYEDARQAYLRALEIERDYRPAIASLSDVCTRVNRYADAAAWQVRWLTLVGRKDLAAAFDAVTQRDGPQAAMEWLDRWNLAEFQRAPDDHLWDLAYTHARLGNREAAIEFLQRAWERREAGMLQARVDPDLDSLRQDRRFKALLQRIGPR